MSPVLRKALWRAMCAGPVLCALFALNPALRLCASFLLVLGYEARRARADRRRRAWHAAAAELCITQRADGSLHGLISGFQVTVTTEPRQAGRRGRARVFRIDSQGKIPGELWLRPMPCPGRARSVGDRAFEARVHSVGPEALVHAALSHACRHQPVFDRPWSGELRYGVLEYRDDDEPLVALTRELVSAARALSLRPRELLPRLTNNLRNDPDFQVRARNLEAIDRLLAHDRPAAQERARRALQDCHPAVRLIAARMLPDLDTVVRVARRDPDPHVRASLLLHLSGFAGARLRPTLRSALASPHLEERRAAIVACGNIGERWAARALAEHARCAELGVVQVVVQALARVGGPDSERALIGLLDHRNRTIRLAASTALGNVGTLAAVEPLLERGAHSAARAIQARLHGADRGRLSLASEARDGALSEVGVGPELGALSASVPASTGN